MKTMKITEIWFDADYIIGRDEKGREYKQSLLWYPRLRSASAEERSQYTMGLLSAMPTSGAPGSGNALSASSR